MSVILVTPLLAQTVNISVDASQDRIAVSPYIYGKNDGVGSPGSPLSEAGFQLFRDAGVKMLRMNGGNNGTKYNWQKRLTSHPDWYNNVSKGKTKQGTITSKVSAKRIGECK